MQEGLQVDGFKWEFELIDSDGESVESEIKHNLIPSDGLEFLIRSPFGEVSPISTFYLGLFRGNYIPTPSTKASDIPTNMIELVDYAEPMRIEWDNQLNGIATMDNLSNKAEFTITQDRTIHGAFLVSEATKGSNVGLVLSCVRFSSPKQVTAGQTVKLSGGLTYTSTSLV